MIKVVCSIWNVKYKTQVQVSEVAIAPRAKTQLQGTPARRYHRRVDQCVSSCDVISSRTTMSCTCTTRRPLLDRPTGGARHGAGDIGDCSGCFPCRTWSRPRPSKFGTGKQRGVATVSACVAAPPVRTSPRPSQG